MKKTLIALAVAASAAVSGSAMAWTANGDGGSVDLGGTLTPPERDAVVWEVKTGDAVSDLDAQIQEGENTVDVTVNNAIPILGIRTVTTDAFTGGPGLAPQISYGDAVDVNGFNNGYAPLTLEVKDATNDEKIGTAEASVLAAAAYSYFSATGTSYNRSLYASDSGKGFFGGIGVNSGSVVTYPVSVTSHFFEEASQNYNSQEITFSGKGETTFASTSGSYSGFYASGIEQGKTIKITLDKAASGDAPIQWKASLPVTVSYQ